MGYAASLLVNLVLGVFDPESPDSATSRGDCHGSAPVRAYQGRCICFCLCMSFSSLT
jgi:hypothetical protein